MKNNRIVIGYKNPIGYFQDFIATRHRYIEDLTIDLNRMIQHCDTSDISYLSGIEVYALGTIDDDTGIMKSYETPEFLVQFPVQVKEVKK